MVPGKPPSTRATLEPFIFSSRCLSEEVKDYKMKPGLELLMFIKCNALKVYISKQKKLLLETCPWISCTSF
jgi:hypothetical protein